MDQHAHDRWRSLVVFGLTTPATCLALIWLAGCGHGAPPSNEQLQQKAAQTTQQVKAGAQQAAADARTAAATAVDKVNAVAAGVKQGLGKPSPVTGSAGAVDINSASEAQLILLPGINMARARRIIDNRPYGTPHDLVKKSVLSAAQYDRLAGRITVGNN
jgi:DNA uptake protein ComE-like DNA-binding protein